MIWSLCTLAHTWSGLCSILTIKQLKDAISFYCYFALRMASPYVYGVYGMYAWMYACVWRCCFLFNIYWPRVHTSIHSSTSSLRSFHFIIYALTVHRRRVLINTQLKTMEEKGEKNPSSIFFCAAQKYLFRLAEISAIDVCNTNQAQSIVLFIESIRLKRARCTLIVRNWHDFHESRY